MHSYIDYFRYMLENCTAMNGNNLDYVAEHKDAEAIMEDTNALMQHHRGIHEFHVQKQMSNCANCATLRLEFDTKNALIQQLTRTNEEHLTILHTVLRKLETTYADRLKYAKECEDEVKEMFRPYLMETTLCRKQRDRLAGTHFKRIPERNSQ